MKKIALCLTLLPAITYCVYHGQESMSSNSSPIVIRFLAAERFLENNSGNEPIITQQRADAYKKELLEYIKNAKPKAPEALHPTSTTEIVKD